MLLLLSTITGPQCFQQCTVVKGLIIRLVENIEVMVGESCQCDRYSLIPSVVNKEPSLVGPGVENIQH